MTELTEKAKAALAARREREAAALRANLRRRKAQTAEPAPERETDVEALSNAGGRRPG